MDRLRSKDLREWADSKGRLFLVQSAGFTEGDDDPTYGLLIGPPLELRESLKEWPEELLVRLHNELYYRGLFTLDDIKTRPVEVEAALKSALKTDSRRVMEAYSGNGE